MTQKAEQTMRENSIDKEVMLNLLRTNQVCTVIEWVIDQHNAQAAEIAELREMINPLGKYFENHEKGNYGDFMKALQGQHQQPPGVEELQQQLADVKKLNFRADYEAAHAALETALERNGRLENQLVAMTKERDELQIQVEGWTETYSLLSNERMYWKQEADRLAAELAELKRQHDTDTERLVECLALIEAQGTKLAELKTARANAVQVFWTSRRYGRSGTCGEYRLEVFMDSENWKWKICGGSGYGAVLKAGESANSHEAKLAAEAALRELMQPAPAATPSDKPKSRPFDEIHEEYRQKLMPIADEPNEPTVENPWWFETHLDHNFYKYIDTGYAKMKFRPSGEPFGVFVNKWHLSECTKDFCNRLPGEPEAVRKWRENNKQNIDK